MRTASPRQEPTSPCGVLLAHASDGYLYTDARGTIRVLNRAFDELLGRRGQLVVGKPLVVLASDPQRLVALIEIARRARAPQTWSGRLALPSGPSIDVLLVAVPHVVGEQVVGIDWLVRDPAAARRHSALQTLLRQALAEPDPPALLDLAAARVAEALAVDHAAAWLLAPEESVLRLGAAVGSPATMGDQKTVPATSASLEGYTLLVGGTVVIADLAQEARFGAPLLAAQGMRSGLCTPIPGHPGPLGTLGGYSRDARAFSDAEREFLEVAAGILGLALAWHHGEAKWTAHLARAEAAEVRYQELERLRQTFLSAISHELLTPVAIIKGHAETLRDPATRATPILAQAALEAIDEESERLQRLVANLLDAARAAAGTFRVERVPLALGPIVEQAVARFRGRSRRHHFRLVLPDVVPLIVGDRERLSGVLYNLLDNALKYAPHGGEVTAIVTVHTEAVEVAVVDQGIGMAPDEQARVFQPYYRATGSGPRPGSGLGLYVCKTIVDALGGCIWIDSERGRGTTVRFTVPRAEAAGSARDGADADNLDLGEAL